MANEMRFTDCIDIITDKYDSIIYTPVYCTELGLYLHCDDDKPIKYIILNNSILSIYYIDGSVSTLDDNVMSVTVEEGRFTKRMNRSIQGTLFQYTTDDALLYNLDMTKAYPVLKDGITRKRSL